MRPVPGCRGTLVQQGLGQLHSFPALEVGVDRGCAVGFPNPMGTFFVFNLVQESCG